MQFHTCLIGLAAMLYEEIIEWGWVWYEELCRWRRVLPRWITVSEFCIIPRPYAIYTLRTKPLFVFLSEEEKRRCSLNHLRPLKLPHPELLDWSTLVFFFCQTFFFECEHRFIDKSLRITEPAVPSARLLVLGWKLYPSSMQRMLNKDLTWFTQSLFRVRRNQAGERKVLDDRPPPVIDIKLNSMIVSLFI